MYGMQKNRLWRAERLFRTAICALWLVLVGGLRPRGAVGQTSRIVGSLEEKYNLAHELYDAGKYAVAQSLFAEVARASSGAMSLRKGDAAYYVALCAVQLERGDAKFLMTRFIERYPASQHVNGGRLALANLYYRKREYEQALEWYEQIAPSAFDRELEDEIAFKKGYALFQLGEKERAFQLLARTKDRESYYQAPSRYYYGHIAYEKGLYSTALEELEKLADDESFAPIIPYYIAQIYYQQGEYARVVEYVTPLLGALSGKREREMLRMLADANFRLGHYGAALPVMARYMALKGGATREDNYLMGFLYIQQAEYDKAIPYLERVVGEGDAVTQNASYHLADCYLKAGDKDRARKALQMAAEYDFDRDIQEDALFNFAKLTYEQRFNPFVDAVDAFTKYIQLYPDSRRKDEAYTYLGMAFAATKNYQKALDALEQIDDANPVTRRAIQRAAFYRGVELFQNSRFAEASARFLTSLENGQFDPTLKAKALYWEGESDYRQQKYPLAARYFQEFYRAPGGFTLPQYRIAPYNIGYAYFKMKSFDQAVSWFRTFVDNAPPDRPELKAEAYSRLGDCFYMQKKYWPAVEAYEKADACGNETSDYALYQKGMTLGLVDRPEKKVGVLSQLPQRYPNSLLIAQTLYQIALTKQSLDLLDEAKREYLTLVERYPSSPLAPSSLVQAGLVNFAQSDYEGAAAQLERVVHEYPGTPEMHEALAALEQVYNAKGDVGGYLAFLDRVGQTKRVSQPQRDSLYYSTAESFYLVGDCEKSVRAFREYLNAFPQGKRSLEANSYLADCLLKNRDSAQAIAPLEEVIRRQPNMFLSRAYLELAQVYTQQRQWGKAEEIYSQLEHSTTQGNELLKARNGKLRCALALEDDENTIDYATTLLATEGISPVDRLFAKYQIAQALRRANRLEQAFSLYSELGVNTGSYTGAEARFRMVEIRFMQRQWAEVKREVIAFSKQNTPHVQWLGKAFLLLGEAYIAQEDYFQAKATLRSIIDHYANKEDGVVARAQALLGEIQGLESHGAPEAQSDTIQIKIDQGNAGE